MSSGRILLAGILGGIAMFVWTSVAHMATPLGMVGINLIPNEQPVITAMQSSMGNQRGFYFFPSMGVPMDASRAERNAAMANYQAILDKSPSGILIYKPAGEKAMTMGQLGTEFGLEAVEALLLAALISMTALRTFGARMGFALVVGIIAAVSTNMSYWTWYGFPFNYTCATMFVEVMKYIVAGTVIAWMAGRVSNRQLGAAA
jgi:hypothetical protein